MKALGFAHSITQAVSKSYFHAMILDDIFTNFKEQREKCKITDPLNIIKPKYFIITQNGPRKPGQLGKFIWSCFKLVMNKYSNS